MSAPPTLLLTGATGLVGGEWLPRLRSRSPDATVAVLTRRTPPEGLAQPGVVVLRGDLLLPCLGLPPERYRSLQRSLTTVVHCAADVRFSAPLEESRRSNVGGTRNLLQFAEGCPWLTRFAHVSTVYVAGAREGPLPEEPLPAGHAYMNPYQQSKHEAEQLVRDAARRLPAAVYRLSSIIGDSRTGRVRQFNYFHQLLKLVPRNPLPVIPGDPDAPVDLIASDWCAAALDHLLWSSFEAGRVHHVCAGPERSMTVRDVVARAFALSRDESGWGALRSTPPELVSLEEFNRYVSSRRGACEGLVRELLRVVGWFLPHLGLRQEFLNGETLSRLEQGGVMMPPVEECYERVVRYCVRTRWGAKALEPG